MPSSHRLADHRLPPIAWIGLYTPALIALYFVAMRVIFAQERHRRAQETKEVAQELQYGQITLRSALVQYSLAAVAVIAAALWLPQLGAELARQTGLPRARITTVYNPVVTPELAALAKRLDRVASSGGAVAVEVDEHAGTAPSRAYYTVFQQLEGSPLQPIIAGRYHDTFARADGEWRLTERVIFCDLVGDLSQHLTVDPFA